MDRVYGSGELRGTQAAQCNAQPEKVLELPEAMARLNHCCQRLEEGVRELHQRFEPALTPATPSPESGAVDPRFASPLAQAVNEQVRRLERVEDAMNDILRRAQI